MPYLQSMRLLSFGHGTDMGNLWSWYGMIYEDGARTGRMPLGAIP